MDKKHIKELKIEDLFDPLYDEEKKARDKWKRQQKMEKENE